MAVHDLQTGKNFENGLDYVNYFISRDANIKVTVTDGTNTVATIFDGAQTQGRNEVSWDGKDDSDSPVVSGIYYYKITSTDNPSVNETKEFRLSRVTYQISSPWQDSLVRAYIPINGVAFGDEFKSFKLFYGPGQEPAVWTELTDYPNPTNVPVQFDSVLGLWDTGYDFEAHCTPNVIYPSEGLNGIYTVKLEVTDIYDQIHTDSVTVIVGRVLSNEQGGTGKSPDENVFLRVEALSMEEPFIVCAILPVPSAQSQLMSRLFAQAPDKTLVGSVYEIRPPAMEFSIPATLEMNYTEEDLDLNDDGTPDIDESKLAIYVWDVEYERWHYVKGTADTNADKIIAEITRMPKYRAYYAILEDKTPPQTPIIFEPSQTLERPSINLMGIAEEFNQVDVALDGTDTQTIITAGEFHGFYRTDVENDSSDTCTIKTRSADPIGNISDYSEERAIQGRY